MAVLTLALRTYARYAVPLVLLSALVFAPLLWLVLRMPAPDDVEPAKRMYRLAWVIAAAAWIAQFQLVGAVAPAVRGLAAGKPLTQLRALWCGLGGLARMVLPCLTALAAIVVGGFALVLPGLALVVLLALTGASEQRGLPAPLVDSIAVAKAHLRLVVIVVVAIIALDLAIAAVAHFAMFVPIAAKKPTAPQLEAARNVVRVVVVALAVVSPLAAAALAAVRARTR